MSKHFAAACVAALVVLTASLCAGTVRPSAAAVPEDQVREDRQSPLLGVWCYTISSGQGELQIYKVTGATFTGKYWWIGPTLGEHNVNGTIGPDKKLRFNTTYTQSYILEYTGDRLVGETNSTFKGARYFPTFYNRPCGKEPRK